MSSEYFMFENSFFSNPFSPSIDDDDISFQTIPNNFIETNSFQETSFLDDYDEISLDQIESILLSSSSPPTNEFEYLSLSQTNSMEVIKIEESNLPFETYTNNCDNNNYNANRIMMQRSYSSNSFDNTKSFLFQPKHWGSGYLHTPESSFSSSQMRRVSSTGDLHKMKTTHQKRNILSTSSPLSTEGSFIEEAMTANMKASRYSAEERKERVDRYRAKRTQRNFNKTIKYACRKTLADTRPRIRGRFARNEEAATPTPGDQEHNIPKTPPLFSNTLFRYGDLCRDERLHEEDNDIKSDERAQFFKTFNFTQAQYYMY